MKGSHNVWRNEALNGIQVNLKLRLWLWSRLCGKSTENHTFIKALESLPVHCLKPWPIGKWRKPVKGGASDILEVISIIALYNLFLVNLTYNRFHQVFFLLEQEF